MVTKRYNYLGIKINLFKILFVIINRLMFYNLINYFIYIIPLFFVFYDFIKKYFLNLRINQDNIIIITDINDENRLEMIKYNAIDINNEIDFMNIYSKFKINDQLNIIIHSNGGDISSSDAIVNILYLHKGIVNIYIPNIAYSAGSMIALCGDNIFMNNYSLMSPVDPQIDFSNDDGDLIPVKSFLKIVRTKGLKKLKNDFILKYYECKSLYDDNIRHMKNILDRKYSISVKKNIIRNFGHGIYPHERQFNIKELKDMGLNVKTPVPSKIYKLFLKIIKKN